MDYGVWIVEAIEIDRINIHRATLEAMSRAVARLRKKPDFMLIDGSFVFETEIPAINVVQGDSLVQAIAAASNLAKVTRDHIREGYHELYPEYGFRDHMGYGTQKHLAAIEKHGPCSIHRMSFGVLKERAL